MPDRKPRPYSRKQALQNAAFLEQLERTGNARDAARVTGLNRSMLTKRRNADPDFAQRWEAALTLAAARLARPDQGQGPARVVRSKGRLQLRVGKTRTIDRDAEQRFLAALSATANVRLSAAAAGFAHSSFYARARNHPGFARECASRWRSAPNGWRRRCWKARCRRQTSTTIGNTTIPRRSRR